VAYGAFERPGGGLTLGNVRLASRGVYAHGFIVSIELSLIVAVIGALAGVFVAMAIHRAPQRSPLRRIAVTASGVFANFGGVPLAFIFIATLGTSGFGTRLLEDIGLKIYSTGFNLYAFSGLVLVYLYWEVPLMVLVILPALQALVPTQREAASNLGASSWVYWTRVGIPVLLPSIVGAALLLFGSAFSAYATAEALTSGSVPLTAIQIGSFLNGNVIAGQANVGKALGLGMIVVAGAVMVIYALLQRRVARWTR
jgi:putative spermidine/putrescine transport system permease protein